MSYYSRINKIGVELEGGWATLFKHAEIVSEISLPLATDLIRIPHWGEIVSPPMDPRQLYDWMMFYYPDKIPKPEELGTAHEKSAGLHLHVSLKDACDYTKICSREFSNYVYERLEVWGNLKGLPTSHVFWSRLRGENRFTRRLFFPAFQTGRRDKDSSPSAARRTHINYCYGLHGTVEFRMLPMFETWKLSYEALALLIASVEEFAVSPHKDLLRPITFHISAEDFNNVCTF